jgi:hypothetical protein
MRVQSSPRKRCRSAAGRGQACSFVSLVSCSFTRHASMLSPSDGQPRTRRPARLGLQLTRRPDTNPVMRATISVARLRGGVPSHTLVSRLPPRPIRPARRDIILHGRDELLATAREMGLFEQRSIAPTSTPCAGSSRSAPCTSVYVRLQISHACAYCGQISCIALTPRCHTHSRSCSCRPLPQGDAGKSLLSFLLREGSLVREGGLRTALESVCDSSRRQRCDVDLLQKVRSAAVSHATTYA